MRMTHPTGNSFPSLMLSRLKKMAGNEIPCTMRAHLTAMFSDADQTMKPTSTTSGCHILVRMEAAAGTRTYGRVKGRRMVQTWAVTGRSRSRCVSRLVGMALSFVRSGDVCPFGQAARGRRDRAGWPCRRSNDDGSRISPGTTRGPHAWMFVHTTCFHYLHHRVR